MRILQGEDGFTSVNFMLMMLVLIIAVGAISVDLWNLVAEHREVAGVVDGAAISAANAVDREALRQNPPQVRLRPDLAIARACSYLQTHVGVGACPGPDVRVLVEGDMVSVTMRRDVGLTLLRVFSGLNAALDTSPIGVMATSTAGATRR